MKTHDTTEEEEEEEEGGVEVRCVLLHPTHQVPCALATLSRRCSPFSPAHTSHESHMLTTCTSRDTLSSGESGSMAGKSLVKTKVPS